MALRQNKVLRGFPKPVQNSFGHWGPLKLMHKPWANNNQEIEQTKNRTKKLNSKFMFIPNGSFLRLSLALSFSTSFFELLF